MMVKIMVEVLSKTLVMFSFCLLILILISFCLLIPQPGIVKVRIKHFDGAAAREQAPVLIIICFFHNS